MSKEARGFVRTVMSSYYDMPRTTAVAHGYACDPMLILDLELICRIREESKVLKLASLACLVSVSCFPVTLKKADDEETKRLDEPGEGRREVAKCPQMEFEIGDLTDDGEDDRGGRGWHGGGREA